MWIRVFLRYVSRNSSYFRYVLWRGCISWFNVAHFQRFKIALIVLYEVEFSHIVPLSAIVGSFLDAFSSVCVFRRDMSLDSSLSWFVCLLSSASAQYCLFCSFCDIFSICAIGSVFMDCLRIKVCWSALRTSLDLYSLLRIWHIHCFSCSLNMRFCLFNVFSSMGAPSCVIFRLPIFCRCTATLCSFLVPLVELAREVCVPLFRYYYFSQFPFGHPQPCFLRFPHAALHDIFPARCLCRVEMSCVVYWHVGHLYSFSCGGLISRLFPDVIF